MRIHGWMLIVLGMLSSAVKGDEGAVARALIDEAIRAHGGEAALVKWQAVTVRTEGIFHGYERTPVFFFTGEVTNHGAERYRAVLDGEITVPGAGGPQSFQVINVFDGQRGWIKMAGETKRDTQEFTQAQLHEAREKGYLAWISTLVPLKKPEFTLTLAGEAEVDGPAFGVQVSCAGHRDVTLFFDKETRLLVKTEMRGQAGTGVEGKVETRLSLHKAIEGVQRPMMWSTSHDGQQIISHWVREYQVAETPEKGVFDKP